MTQRNFNPSAGCKNVHYVYSVFQRIQRHLLVNILVACYSSLMRWDKIKFPYYLLLVCPNKGLLQEILIHTWRTRKKKKNQWQKTWMRSQLEAFCCSHGLHHVSTHIRPGTISQPVSSPDNDQPQCTNEQQQTNSIGFGESVTGVC